MTDHTMQVRRVVAQQLPLADHIHSEVLQVL